MRMASVRSSETVGKMKMDIKIDIDREKENIKMEKRNGQQTSRAGQVWEWSVGGKLLEIKIYQFRPKQSSEQNICK